ncbi:hypothetical protein [Streptococcus hillyeri]|uniref:Uncharacterized protein n=1 Tax=Streptococcus hillyeri TaxID=2282420 RepID=A0A3L9DTX3_9STRE|nr:hypothetical protein [Streptococcus hillyeri]RLY02200.1 hypothetical protein EAF07_08085 [Streptococcus hillyeri]
MNNLQIIILATIVSVTLIESLLMNVRLTKALKDKQSEPAKKQPKAKTGFIDFETGRRVDIDPVTGKERFID